MNKRATCVLAIGTLGLGGAVTYKLVTDRVGPEKITQLGKYHETTISAGIKSGDLSDEKARQLYATCRTDTDCDPRFKAWIASGAMDDKAAWQLYEKRSGDIDGQIAACRTAADCNPRFRAWVDTIDETKGISDKLLKAEIVNGWANTEILYLEYEASVGDVQKYKTTAEMLKDGTGMCVDTASIKYETLRRVGFDDSELRVLGGYFLDDTNPKALDGHLTLMANINGRNWILDNGQDDYDAKVDYTNVQKRKDIFADNAGLDSDYALVREEKFLATDAVNNSLYRQYTPGPRTLLPSFAPVFPDSSFKKRVAKLDPAQARTVDRIIAEAFDLSFYRPSAHPPAPPPAPKP